MNFEDLSNTFPLPVFLSPGERKMVREPSFFYFTTTTSFPIYKKYAIKTLTLNRRFI
jgi:hypothetical protein